MSEWWRVSARNLAAGPPIEPLAVHDVKSLSPGLEVTVMIHCPSCGDESSLDQKFCRKCGFNLEPVGKLVTAGPDLETKSEKLESEQAILRRMIRWMMWGCLVLLIGLVLLVSGKAFDLPKFLSPLASFLLVGGAAAAGYGVLAALRDGMASRESCRARTRPARNYQPHRQTNWGIKTFRCRCRV